MAEAGSFAERVKQQADIVRMVGEYVRLKKTGQNFTGLCPFHQEKTPSFSVHAVRQFYHCFGCGKSGDIFKFVMEMERCAFPEAVRMVAEKCGIAVPSPRESAPGERRENQQRAALLEMHREAATFFARMLNSSDEGKVARAYLEDRGLDAEAITRFGIGYAPSAGEALLKRLKSRYAECLLDASGLFLRDQAGRRYDRFRRRITFPIANESGKIIAFGGRALGDDNPKYLNSPETLIYRKSNVLYHLDRAKETIRKHDFAVLVEGYMDTIAVARAGVSNVIASCGTSLADGQIRLLRRFSRRVVVNYDPDAAGQAAVERSLILLLEREFDVRVLVLPAGADPDKFIKEYGAENYVGRLREAPSYFDYLIARARAMPRITPEEKLAALNFLMPYAQRIPNGLLRSEIATRIASELRVEEPVLREALRRAVTERRSEVKTRPELMRSSVRPAERRLLQMLVEAEGFRRQLAAIIVEGALHKGLETEKIFEALLEPARSESHPDAAVLAEALPERERKLVFEILFEETPEPTWEEAESCLNALKRGHLEQQIAALQRQLDAPIGAEDRREIFTRTAELRKQLAALE